MFSLVVPVYNVATFLPAFLDSLAAQSEPLTDCEVIFVNDGSTDASASLIRAWIQRVDVRAEVVDQENQGLSAARNAGLERATGTWVTFPDPDDVLDPDYLARVRAFLAATPEAPDLVCTRLLLLDDATGAVTDAHPLRTRFRGGTRIVDLGDSPEVIHLSAASAFYRRARIEELGLRFDGSIVPNFEDGSFTTLYLVASDRPTLGLVAEARYLYRRRSDASSLVQHSWLREEKYTTVMERGYLALLRRVEAEHGSIPAWVQNVVLYDLLFYFRIDERAKAATAAALPDWTDRFHALTEQILAHIDVATIERFSVMPTSEQLRAALIIGYKHERLVPGVLRRDRRDGDQQLVRLRYFCGGPPPVEEISIDGASATAAFAKTRDVAYLGRVVMHERILWLPDVEGLRVSIGGREVPVVGPTAPRDRPRSAARRLKSWIRARLPWVVAAVRRARGQSAAGSSSPGRGLFARLDAAQAARLRHRAGSSVVRQRFADAWAFIDRDTEAHDNAEHLYRYVLHQHPEVNAWFVLRADAADWDRLASEGFRLVRYGSADHALLLLNAAHVVSSQVDDYVTHPLPRSRFGDPRWRLTFLQHGVIHTDLSRWLNPKPIDRFITSSTAEHAGIVGDHTPYVFTEREVRLTGMPRQDRLLDLKQAAGDPRLILVMPSWRASFMTPGPDGNARVLTARLADTEFWRSWSALLESAELRRIAEAAGLEIAFVPHPNLQAHIGPEDLPAWVSLHRFDRSDVQALLAEAMVMITDYSSQAFDAAYVECPVVYYQFDRDTFFAGTHVGRSGTWDYARDGFGPMTTTPSTAVEAVRDVVMRGGAAEPYASRMRDAFPYRDGRCRERTFESIRDLTRPFSPAGPGGRIGGRGVDSSSRGSQSRG